jgi:hypothetical protein
MKIQTRRLEELEDARQGRPAEARGPAEVGHYRCEHDDLNKRSKETKFRLLRVQMHASSWGTTLSHSPMPRDTRSQCDPVDTRTRTNVEKRGEGLTRRGDGGPRAKQPRGRSGVLQTDSRDCTRAGVSRQFCDGQSRCGTSLLVSERFDGVESGGATRGVQTEHEADGHRHEEREQN